MNPGTDFGIDIVPSPLAPSRSYLDRPEGPDTNGSCLLLLVVAPSYEPHRLTNLRNDPSYGDVPTKRRPAGCTSARTKSITLPQLTTHNWGSNPRAMRFRHDFACVLLAVSFVQPTKLAPMLFTIWGILCFRHSVLLFPLGLCAICLLSIWHCAWG